MTRWLGLIVTDASPLITLAATWRAGPGKGMDGRPSPAITGSADNASLEAVISRQTLRSAASIEQRPQPLLDLIREIQRNCLDR